MKRILTSLILTVTVLAFTGSLLAADEGTCGKKCPAAEKGDCCKGDKEKADCCKDKQPTAAKDAKAEKKTEKKAEKKKAA